MGQRVYAQRSLCGYTRASLHAGICVGIRRVIRLPAPPHRNRVPFLRIMR